MKALATTRLSTRGQVVIPGDVRARLGLRAGARFVVMAEGDVVILKVIAEPSRSEFSALAAKVRRRARRAGLRKADLKEAVRSARNAR